MFNKQGMIFYVASTILTNGRNPYIYSSAVVKQCASNRFTNCHTYYLFISGQKLKKHTSLPTGKIARCAVKHVYNTLYYGDTGGWLTVGRDSVKLIRDVRFK